MKLAVIPARGGSKRIPRKNIRNFCGKPIIGYSIEAALASDCFDQIVVSTDDEEIAAVGRQYGAAIPFIRPSEISDDYTGTNDVVKHAIKWFLKQGETIDYVCCIYATAPFVRPEFIKRGLQNLESSDRLFSFSVTSFAFPVQRALKIIQDGGIEPVNSDLIKSRSQDLEETYHDAGQFYWGKAEAFLNDVALFSDASVPTVLPRYLVQDIDTLEDWHRAELMYRSLTVDP